MQSLREVRFLLFGLALLTTCGCGDGRPSDMPPLFPTTIAVTQDGQPLADATVTLYPENSSLTRWPVGAVSDEGGVATLSTYGQYSGAPAGNFKVLVNKTVTEGDPVPEYPGPGATQEQLAAYDRAMKTGDFKSYKVVAKEFRQANTSPLEVTVTAEGENHFTVDVGKAVKEADRVFGATKNSDYEPMGGTQEGS